MQWDSGTENHLSVSQQLSQCWTAITLIHGMCPTTSGYLLVRAKLL